MKALKVFVTIILGIMTVFLVGVFGLLTAGRIVLSGNNISSIVKELAKETGEFDVKDIFGSDIQISSEEFDDAVSEMKEYGIDVDKIYDEFGDFASQVIKYSIGMSDEIDTKSLKKVLKDTAKKYEAKTGEEIDLDEIDKGIDEGVKEMKRDLRETKKENREGFAIMGAILGPKTYFGILIGIIVCAVLIILINKSVVPLAVTYIVTSILGIFGNLGFFALARFTHAGSEKAVNLILNSLSNIFLGIAGVFLVILVISIVAIVISKKQRKVITT